MRSNYKIQRLFVDQSLFNDSSSDQHLKIALSKDQTHYIVNVLRMKLGDEVLVFNGRDGEWRSKIIEVSKKAAILQLQAIERNQPEAIDLIYYFAPLKHARLDYMVQKAVEMGASALQPILTQYTQVNRLNIERMKANIIEAAEQCGIITVPSCFEPISLKTLLENWDPKRYLMFCDEAEEENNPLQILQKLPPAPLGVLIGPEGGFSDIERELIRSYSFSYSIGLGPRILRADTAAVAALALIGATLGDWKKLK